MMLELLCILQNKFRRKYEQALTKCWMICVPCSSALRGIDITDEFVGMLQLFVTPFQHVVQYVPPVMIRNSLFPLSVLSGGVSLR
jgi:hypothetical protein